VPRARRQLPPLAGLVRAQAPLRLGLDQDVERPLQEHRQVACRNHVAEELPRALDLLPQLGARGELHAIARRRQRFHPRPWLRSRIRRNNFAWLGTGNQVGRQTGQLARQLFDAVGNVGSRTKACQELFELAPRLLA
jgi:hypothetical protein